MDRGRTLEAEWGQSRAAIAAHQEKDKNCNNMPRRYARESRPVYEEARMAMHKQTVSPPPGDSRNGFPAEAAQVYDEVSAEAMEALRQEMEAMYGDSQMELLDGFDYPYPKRA